MSRDLTAPEHRRMVLDSVRDYLEQLAEEGLEGLPATTATRTAAPKASTPASKPAAPAASALVPGDASSRAADTSSPRPAPAPM